VENKMFKKFLFLPLLFFIFTSFCDTNTKQKFYRESIENYEKLNKNITILYNMGNCYFKLKDYTNALIFWRRAQNKGNLKDIEYNIRYLKDMLNHKQDSWLYRYFISFPILFFQLFLLLIIFLLSLFLPKILREKQNMLLIIFLFLGIWLGASLIGRYFIKKSKFAVVNKNNVSLYIIPEKDTEVVGVLNIVDEVKIIQKIDNWYKIRKKSLIGWVISQDINIV
jgi:tetratricopeptide (TPR) repeat protein